MKYRGFTIILSQEFDCDWFEWIIVKKKHIWFDPTFMPSKESCIYQAKCEVDYIIKSHNKKHRYVGSRKNTYKRWFDAKAFSVSSRPHT